MRIVGEPHYDEDKLTDVEHIAINNEMKLVLKMMNGEEGSLYVESPIG